MKKSTTLWAALCLAFGTQAQTVFEEGFENGVPGQLTQTYEQGIIDWNNDASNIGVNQPAAAVGAGAAFFFYPDLTFDETSLVTPTLDLSAGVFKLSFQHIQATWFGDQNTLAISISTDGGQNWTEIETFFTDISVWTPREYNLGDYVTLSATTQIRFTGTIAYGYAIGLDEVRVFAPLADDMAISSIATPLSGCNLGNETVTLTVFNNGINAITAFDASYVVNGGAAVIESFTANLAAGQSTTISFTQTIDASAFGTYNVQAWVSLAGEMDATNDTTTTSFENIESVTSLPYFNDFENGGAGWTAEGQNGTWELGDPEGFLIDTAYSGVNCWSTNLNATTYQNEQFSYLTSPCFDLTGVALDPILEFAIAYNSEDFWDGTWVEVSVDGGLNWAAVGTVGSGLNWYNVEFPNNPFVTNPFWAGNSTLNSEWVKVRHLLTGAANQSSVRFRIAFSSDLSVNGFEGFALDDIELREQPAINAEVLTIVSPISGCALSTSETLTVSIVNAGSDPITDIELFYLLDDNTTQSEVFTVNLGALDTTTVTFTNALDLGTAGDYSLTVWAALPGEGDTENDTVAVMIGNYPVVGGIPYFIDFENGSGGWSSTGTNGLWELGDPDGTIINTPYSGNNCWATNLNTLLYQNEQYSVLTSPCFDMSNITDDPLISFAIQFNSEPNWDGVWVEKSTDGGNTWSIVGAPGQGENWYNTAESFNQLIPGPFWAGNSGTNSQWVMAENILSGVAGSSDVKVRIIFSSDLSVNGYEGFALDDIRIRPQPQLDLVAKSMPTPNSGCDLASETVRIKFWNKGLQTVQNFLVGYSVDGGANVTQNCPLILAQGDTAEFAFSTPANLSAAGNHSIIVFTALVGDEDPSNDASSNNVVVNYQNTPLSQSISPNLPISAEIVEGTSSTLYFCGMPNALTGCFKIESITIDSIPHTYISDLNIYLRAPWGDQVALSLGNGGFASNVFDVVFSDDAANSITSQVDGILPGTYAPQEPLSTLYTGQDPNGPWTLFIEDGFFGDDGILQKWSLTFADNQPEPTLANDITMCINYTETITVSGGTFDSYLWSNGMAGNPLTISGAELGVGTHQLSVAVSLGGCTGQSNIISVIVNPCTGISETNNADISVYPNPSQGAFTIELPATAEQLNVNITDATGRVLAQKGLASQTDRQQMHIEGLAPGVYFVKIESGTLRHVERVVIH